MSLINNSRKQTNLIFKRHHSLLFYHKFKCDCLSHTRRKEGNSKGNNKRTYSVSSPFHQQNVANGSPRIIDLVKIFPSGIKSLYNDYLRYQNIKDASQTKSNAWSNLKYHMPRRQYQQQKQFIYDVQKVLIPVSMALLPIIGNLFIIGFAVQPRLFLSDHFFSIEQIRYYVSKEYHHRRNKYFMSCNSDIWQTLKMNETLASCFSSCKKDVWQTMRMNSTMPKDFSDNIMNLYLLFQQCHFGSMTRHQLLNIAFSSPLSSPLLWLQPTSFIKRRLCAIAQDIIQDDIMLIAESQHLEQCQSMKAKELVNACSIRNLPCGIDQSIEDLRESMTGYLIMIKQILNEVGESGLKSKEGEQFVLYLNIIRDQGQITHESSIHN